MSNVWDWKSRVSAPPNMSQHFQVFEVNFEILFCCCIFWILSPGVLSSSIRDTIFVQNFVLAAELGWIFRIMTEIFKESARELKSVFALLNYSKYGSKTATLRKFATYLTKNPWAARGNYLGFFSQNCAFLTFYNFHFCERNASIQHAGWHVFFTKTITQKHTFLAQNDRNRHFWRFSAQPKNVR